MHCHAEKSRSDQRDVCSIVNTCSVELFREEDKPKTFALVYSVADRIKGRECARGSWLTNWFNE